MKRMIKRVPIVPQNTRLNPTNVARQHEFIARRQQLYVQNALNASGIYCVIFKLVTGGKRCTCSGRVSLLDNNGDLTEQGLLSISKSVQNLYGDTKRVSFKANDMNLDLVLNGDDIIDNPIHEDYADEPPTEVDLLEYGSFNQDYCAVCYGSGYVGGYQLQPGFRLVLDTQSVINTDHILDTANQPAFYHSGTIAQFEAIIPKHNHLQVRLFNNDTEIRGFKFSEIPNGVKGQFTIETTESFTHLELSELTGYIPTDFAQLPEDFGADMLGVGSTATFILGHTTSINKNSLLIESKFGRMWQITNVNPFYDNSGCLIQYEAEARLVAQHELYKYLMGQK